MTGAGWIPGSPGGYNREFCVDLAQLAAFLVASCAEQPHAQACGQRKQRLGFRSRHTRIPPARFRESPQDTRRQTELEANIRHSSTESRVEAEVRGLRELLEERGGTE